MFILTLIIISIISLLFSTTRVLGYFSLLIIAYLYPLVLLLLIALASIYFYFTNTRT